MNAITSTFAPRICTMPADVYHADPCPTPSRDRPTCRRFHSKRCLPLMTRE